MVYRITHCEHCGKPIRTNSLKEAFVDYFIANPTALTRDAADHFNVTVGEAKRIRRQIQNQRDRLGTPKLRREPRSDKVSLPRKKKQPTTVSFPTVEERNKRNTRHD